VSLTPPGGLYKQGTIVSLTAVPNGGWRFTSWSGDLSGGINPGTIEMTGNKTVTATFDRLRSDLDATGTLNWDKVKKTETVTGTIVVKNIGESGSKLNWKVNASPTWGTWTIIPPSGTDLEPGVGTTLTVSMVAPDKRNTAFDGNVTLVNLDDPTDVVVIPAHLKTPTSYHPSIIEEFIQWLFERFPRLEHLFPSLALHIRGI
jgi:hypothetical protein